MVDKTLRAVEALHIHRKGTSARVKKFGIGKGGLRCPVSLPVFLRFLSLKKLPRWGIGLIKVDGRGTVIGDGAINKFLIADQQGSKCHAFLVDGCTKGVDFSGDDGISGGNAQQATLHFTVDAVAVDGPVAYPSISGPQNMEMFQASSYWPNIFCVCAR